MRLFALTVALCASVAVLARQVPTFRSQIDVVQLDVSVLDRDRHPVRGLSPADFTVVEDGVPQSIVAFQVFDIPDPVIPTTTWMREVAPDVTTNRPLAGRLVVVVLDDLSQRLTSRTRYWTDVWSTATSTRVADTIMNQLGPDDLVSVVYTENNDDRAQDFTADRARIRAAVSSFTTRRPSITFNRYQGSCGGVPPSASVLILDELLRVSAALQSEPQRRKTILVVSPGVRIKTERGLANTCEDLLSKQVQREAQRANINIYGIDPGSPPPRNVDALDDLKDLAESTGGRLIPDSRDDDPETRVPGIFEENSSYYLIGFRSTNPAADGKFRRIDVKVNRPGVEVRTRNGYYAGGPATKNASRKATAPPSPLDESVAGVLPMSETPLRLNVAAFSTPGKPGASVAVTLGVRQPASDLRAGGTMLTVIAHAYDLDGNSVAMKRTDVGGQPGSGGLIEYDVIARLDVPPGRYEIRVGAETSTKRRGSVYGYVDVPKFSNDGLWISGPLLERTPALPAAGKDSLAALLPIVPTTSREFAGKDTARAFLRIYQGGRGRFVPAQVAVRIVNADDVTVFEDTTTLGVDRFGDQRAADYTLALPIARLVAGEYLLTLDTAVNALHESRAIRFAIR